MSFRRRFLIVYFSIYLPLSLVLYFGLRTHYQQNFSLGQVERLVNTVSSFRDRTTDLCRYHMLGDPDVGTQYTKLNFWCQDGRFARSTLALTVLHQPTVNQVLSEYARIINFDPELLTQQGWFCLLNDQPLTPTSWSALIKPASTIDCYQNRKMYEDLTPRR